MFGLSPTRFLTPVFALALVGACLPSAHARGRHPSHNKSHHGGGTTYCTFYRDRHGRTASNLAPRGSWVLLSRGGTSMRVKITDTGCNHFDLTPGQFRRFASLSTGVVHGVTWRVLPRK
ncbi:MAG: hypothetical protein ABIY70_19670 [Capsulimonas sp.]|uniref:hypothetical protein n=1 Tax=Capsulimonas sp. TaxID=2494211 RepID=UPI0032656E0C